MTTMPGPGPPSPSRCGPPPQPEQPARQCQTRKRDDAVGKPAPENFVPHHQTSPFYDIRGRRHSADLWRTPRLAFAISKQRLRHRRPISISGLILAPVRLMGHHEFLGKITNFTSFMLQDRPRRNRGNAGGQRKAYSKARQCRAFSFRPSYSKKLLAAHRGQPRFVKRRIS